jgi:hypothetical protein
MIVEFIMRLRKWLEGRRKIGYAVLVLDLTAFPE